MAHEFIPGAGHRALTPCYDAACRLLGLGPALRSFQVERLGELPPRRLLDVGCGTGELLAAVAARFPGSERHGIDPDPGMIEQARSKLARPGLAAQLVVGSGEKLPYPDGHFELVFSSLVFHHLRPETKRAALAEWRRVLAPGGRLALFDLGPLPIPFRARFERPLRKALGPQADNLLGLIPDLLREAGFQVEEAGTYRRWIRAWSCTLSPARPT